MRRLRGLILRFVRRRPLSVACGLALALPAGWLELRGGLDAWWSDGLALILVATGLAVFWTGLTGAAPDWLDDET